MTKKKQEYGEWVRQVQFKYVNGVLVKGVRYIAPPLRLYKPGEGWPLEELPLAPRSEDTATVASTDEIAAYEAGDQAGRKRVLETVRDMSSGELGRMRGQRRHGNLYGEEIIA